MIVKAKHWVKHDGVWHPAGAEFSVDNLDDIKEHVEEVKEKPVRKKKTTEE